MIVYDIEIIKAIPDKNGILEQGIEYCAGWEDHANMGISAICAFDYDEDRYRVFCKDNFQEFKDLVLKTDIVVGFNSAAFDNQVCKFSDIHVPEFKTYDLLIEIWKAAGLGPKFEYPTHAGYGLDAVAKANNIGRKTGHGAKAPIAWQKGHIGSVIDYCLQDVRLTKGLMDNVIFSGGLRCPKTAQKLVMKNPYIVVKTAAQTG